MPMDNGYRDILDGHFTPDITVVKRPDNGHYTASSNGLSATHYDQAQAINDLTAKLQAGLLEGTVYSGS